MPIAQENGKSTSRFVVSLLKLGKPITYILSPSERTKWRSKEQSTSFARYSRSNTIKLSRFILEIKFRGVVSLRHLSSATLIFARTHNTLSCFETLMIAFLIKVSVFCLNRKKANFIFSKESLFRDLPSNRFLQFNQDVFAAMRYQRYFMRLS